MELSPRLVATLAFLALIPAGIYGALSGHLTVVTMSFSVIGIVLIAGSLMLLFGPAPADAEGGLSH
jgi:uncharacterized membrane protein